ncbi:MAG: ABC transporter ATP-binding protein [Christensenellales bacterium]
MKTNNSNAIASPAKETQSKKHHSGQKPKNAKQSLKKLLKLTKVHKKGIITASIFSLFAAVLSMIGPLFIGKITDELHLSLKNGTALNLKLISSIGIFLIVAYVLSLALNYIQGYIMSILSNKIAYKLRGDINVKINKLPLKYFDKNTVGDTLSRISNDVATISSTLSESFSSFISSVVRVVGIIIIMFMISWQLALIAILSLPVTFSITILIIKKSQKYFVKNQKDLGELNGFADETYSAHSLIKTLNIEDKMNKNFEKVNGELAHSVYKSSFYSGLIHPVSSTISNLTYILIAIVGASLIAKDLILVGAIASFVLYVRQFGRPVSQIVSIFGTFQTTLAASERVFEILDENEEEDEKDKTLKFKGKRVKGNVEFKDVCFGYEEGKEIIHSFNFFAPAGSKIAIVGPTGAGKTTIINLLMRFYEINSGEILIDGVNTKDMKRKEVRSLFGMVLQDSWLFEGTIKDNLCYGAKDLSQKKLEEICEKLGVAHFIKTLPEGYNTILNDAAVLSQGQKQLLTIARASIQNAPMLILDEATSNVDTRAEMLIQEAMDKLSKNKTSFVIAHRLSTIKNANQIIVMNEGNIVEVGTHDELLAKQGFYAELYKSQFEE